MMTIKMRKGIIVFCMLILFVLSSFIVVARSGQTLASTTALVQGFSEPFVQIGEQMACENFQDCLELDIVWKKFDDKINSSHKDKIWKPTSSSVGEWVIFNSMYLPESQVRSGSETGDSDAISTQGGGSQNLPGLGSSNSIASLALEEYSEWSEGNINECDFLAQPLLEKYYEAVHFSEDINCDGTPWSAMFISYVMTQAGVNFPASASHSGFFSEIRDNPGSSDCTAYPMSQKANLKVGDIVASCRDSGCPASYSSVKRGDLGHSDIVVKIDSTGVYGIGGNLGGTVKQVKLNLDRSSNYGFISCSSGPITSTQSTSTLSGGSSQKIVVIDPGHGTALNVRPFEDQIILSVSNKLKSLLESQGVQVLMTRTTTGGQIGSAINDNEENYNRAEIANNANADLIIHMHSDAGTIDPEKFLILYPSCQGVDRTGRSGPQDINIIGKSSLASTRIASSLVASNIQGRSVANQIIPGVVGTCNFYDGYQLLTFDAASSVPSVTLEMYSHGLDPLGSSRSNPGGATSLYFDYLENKNGIQDTMASAVAQGIVSYLSVS